MSMYFEAVYYLTLACVIICFYFLLMIPHISDIGVAWSLKMKRIDLHVQNGDLKEASSVFWSSGITRTQENCHTA